MNHCLYSWRVVAFIFKDMWPEEILNSRFTVEGLLHSYLQTRERDMQFGFLLCGQCGDGHLKCARKKQLQLEIWNYQKIHSHNRFEIAVTEKRFISPRAHANYLLLPLYFHGFWIVFLFHIFLSFQRLHNKICKLFYTNSVWVFSVLFFFIVRCLQNC